MSERDRQFASPGDDLGGDEAAEQPASAAFPMPPAAPRPIAPYDPYQSSDAASRYSRRNVAAEGADLRRSHGADSSPFLPDDDPLNAGAWQLELDEIEGAGDELSEDPVIERMEPAREASPAPRRTRRQPASVRSRPEGGAAAGRVPRRRRAETTARQRPVLAMTVPRAVSGASLVSDQTMLALLGINIVSILAMAVVLGLRLGGLPASIVLRLDAAGNPALWGPPSVLWRLPLMSLFITAMFLVVAWFLHPLDRFAARFALAAAVVAQIVAWAAVILHLA